MSRDCAIGRTKCESSANDARRWHRRSDHKPQIVGASEHRHDQTLGFALLYIWKRLWGRVRERRDVLRLKIQADPTQKTFIRCSRKAIGSILEVFLKLHLCSKVIEFGKNTIRIIPTQLINKTSGSWSSFNTTSSIIVLKRNFHKWCWSSDTTGDSVEILASVFVKCCRKTD